MSLCHGLMLQGSILPVYTHTALHFTVPSIETVCLFHVLYIAPWSWSHNISLYMYIDGMTIITPFILSSCMFQYFVKTLPRSVEAVAAKRDYSLLN